MFLVKIIRSFRAHNKVMAITNLGIKFSNKCMMCEGGMEKSNMGNICNTCKDKMKK